MKKLTILCLFLTLVLLGCEVDQTEEGELPEIDVDTEAGDMPEYDVDWANVDVGTTTDTVEVPKVVVVTEKEEIEVPYIDVNMPDGGEKEERTIMVEAEVTEQAHELEIQEVYAAGNRLVVISSLEPTGQALGDETVRISDQLVLNAPDLDVKYYIIGDKPAGDFNNRYTFITTRNDIRDELQGGRTIYSAN